MRKIIGIVVIIWTVIIGTCVFSVSSAQPAQIQASINENQTHVFLEIVNLDSEKTINGYAIFTTLDGSSTIRNFSLPPETSKVIISIKKPKKRGIALAQIFFNENQRQIVLTREITPLSEKKENLPFFILPQNTLIIIAVIGVIVIIGVLIAIKIRSQLPPQW